MALQLRLNFSNTRLAGPELNCYVHFLFTSCLLKDTTLTFKNIFSVKLTVILKG